MNKVQVPYNILHCCSHNNRNAWLLYCHVSRIFFLIDPPNLQPEIADYLNKLYVDKYHCIITRNQREKIENFVQWSQLFPFELISHNREYYDFDLSVQGSHSKVPEITGNLYDEITLVRGKYANTYCLMAYKEPYLFSGDILQFEDQRRTAHDMISQTLLNFLHELPRETVVFPSVGPIGLLRYIPFK